MTMKTLIVSLVVLLTALSAAADGLSTEAFERELGRYRQTWARELPRINADIEAGRKDALTVRVTDGGGRPVTGAVVRIEQLTHDFRFGCSILPLGQLGDANEGYERAFLRLFNPATTTFCLGAVEPVRGEVRFAEGSREIWRRPPPDRVLKFCRRYGVRCKGQPLLAGSWHPDWAKGMDADETRALYADYFRRVAERYGEGFDMFDVVNEAFCHRTFRLYEPEAKYVDWAFAEAAKVFPPRCRLTLNESTPVSWWKGDAYRSGERYFNLARRMVDAGVRLDGIGFQLHYYDGGVGLFTAIRDEERKLRDLRENYGRFAALGRPLYLTELTVPTVPPPQVAADGEALQAEIVANIYRFYFSLPAFAGVTYWNLYDGATYKKGGWDEGSVNGGLLDYAMREKPSYQVLYQLINREWKTFAQVRTGPDGSVSLRGFRGDYRISASQDGKAAERRITLARGGMTAEIRLLGESNGGRAECR